MERLATVRASGVRFAAPLCAFEFHQSGVGKLNDMPETTTSLATAANGTRTGRTGAVRQIVGRARLGVGASRPHAGQTARVSPTLPAGCEHRDG